MRRIIAALAVLALAGCGGSSLEADDPYGFAACTALERSLTSENPTITMGGLLEAGEKARLAETRAIFEAVDEMGEIAPELAEFAIPDVDALIAACNEHGFDLEARP